MTTTAPTTIEAESKPMPDTKIEPERLFVSIARLGPVIAFTIAATVFYMQFKNRMDNIEDKMDRDITTRSNEREALIKSIDGVRDQLRSVFADQVAVRQAQTWIELVRALNHDKYPELRFPDLPR